MTGNLDRLAFNTLMGDPPLTGIVRISPALADLYRTLDELDDPDTNSNGRRADLIDHAIELADLDPECARAWSAYR